MKTRKCTKCDKTKALTKANFAFRKGRKDFDSWCRECLYQKQMAIWKEKKERLVRCMGGECQICGYKRNYASLVLHYKDKSRKVFPWNKLRLRKWEIIMREASKCDLLCANCNGEENYPNLNI